MLWTLLYAESGGGAAVPIHILSGGMAAHWPALVGVSAEVAAPATLREWAGSHAIASRTAPAIAPAISAGIALAII